MNFELIKAIALLCSVYVGDGAADGKQAVRARNMQSECHKYYAQCAVYSPIHVCMQNRPPALETKGRTDK